MCTGSMLRNSCVDESNCKMYFWFVCKTFHTYSQYDQELLCQVFLQSRKRRLLNRRRVGQSLGPKKNRGLPILPMSFQLSQIYYRYTLTERRLMVTENMPRLFTLVISAAFCKKSTKEKAFCHNNYVTNITHPLKCALLKQNTHTHTHLGICSVLRDIFDAFLHFQYLP